jgi:hypothetical protein
MKVKITNKNDIVKSIQEYFKNEEAGEEEEVHFCFQHAEDRERVLEREVSEDETIEVFGYLDSDGEVSMQETDDIVDYYNLEIFDPPADVGEVLKELEQEDIPYNIENYIQYFEAKGEEFETNCGSLSS